jgi:hypothetical protein
MVEWIVADIEGGNISGVFNPFKLNDLVGNLLNLRRNFFVYITYYTYFILFYYNDLT